MTSKRDELIALPALYSAKYQWIVMVYGKRMSTYRNLRGLKGLSKPSKIIHNTFRSHEDAMDEAEKQYAKKIKQGWVKL